MTLVLVVHHPDAAPDAAAEMRDALRDAIWEVADAHWALGADAVLAATDLSPDYLLGHFRRAIARRGLSESGQLLVVPFAPRSAFIGLPPDAAAWVRDQLD